MDAARVVHYGHVVANGSSVDQIAGEFGTTEATLMRLNNETPSDPNNLQAGQSLDVPIKACSSSIVSSLLVPNGSYALTANNCVQCRCNSKDLNFQLDSVPVDSMSRQSILGGMQDVKLLAHHICDYAEYNENRILTVLTNQSACSTPAPSPAPANSAAPTPAPAIEPPAPSPAPVNSAAPAPAIEPPVPTPTPPANSAAWYRRNGRNWSGLLSFVFGLLCLIFP